MKKIITLLLLAFSINTVHAQTFAEWFQQGKTQKKYLAEQIAALQVYIGFLKDGYKTVGKGLNTIGEIKNGDFNLGSTYFSSLKAVSPQVAAYPKAKDVITLQQAIADAIAKSKSQVTAVSTYSDQERTYIFSVYERLTTDCNQTIDDLEAVTTPGKLEMKDDERLQRIDQLFLASQSQYRFAKQYADGLAVLALQKNRTGQEIKNLNTLYNFK